jgi:transcriptional regulator with XRE-family HTH domain
MAYVSLRNILLTARSERQLSLRKAAQLADIDHAYLYRLENGYRMHPSKDVLRRLGLALQCTMRLRQWEIDNGDKKHL